MPNIPHSFRDQSLLDLALTHSSMHANRDNERLEFLGDAALDLVVAEELFKHHSDLPEGDLTELKAWVVSRKTLAEAASEMDLGAVLRLGAGLKERALPRSVLANVYEAVLGAVYLDAGLEAARDYVMATLAKPLEQVRTRSQGQNPKQRFQQVCQREHASLPVYVVVDDRGEAHARAFLVAAEAGHVRYPSAWGRTRKEAEMWAAYEALLVIEGDVAEPSMENGE
ncbi:MAG: ribonuclease III [Planctomycetota bacterium]|nr:ribonuclease III [Planctomycetota bacterium]